MTHYITRRVIHGGTFVISAPAAKGNSSRFLSSTLISDNRPEIKEGEKAIFLSDVTFTLDALTAEKGDK